MSMYCLIKVTHTLTRIIIPIMLTYNSAVSPTMGHERFLKKKFVSNKSNKYESRVNLIRYGVNVTQSDIT